MRRLVIRPGAIGDCILSLPAIESLRADYTEVWVASRNVPLVRGFDATQSIASTGLDRVGLPDLDPPSAVMDRLRGFDSIASWYGANRAEFRAAVAGLPFTFFEALPPEGARIHATDFYLAQCGCGAGAFACLVCAQCPERANSRSCQVIEPRSRNRRKEALPRKWRSVCCAGQYICSGPDGHRGAASRRNHSAQPGQDRTLCTPPDT